MTTTYFMESGSQYCSIKNTVQTTHTVHVVKCCYDISTNLTLACCCHKQVCQAIEIKKLAMEMNTTVLLGCEHV